MLASERAAFLTSSNTWAIAGCDRHVLQPERRLQLLAQVPVLERQAPLAERPVHHDRQLVERERLGQVAKAPSLTAATADLDRGERGDDHHGRAGSSS